MRPERQYSDDEAEEATERGREQASAGFPLAGLTLAVYSRKLSLSEADGTEREDSRPEGQQQEISRWGLDVHFKGEYEANLGQNDQRCPDGKHRETVFRQLFRGASEGGIGEEGGQESVNCPGGRA